MKMKTPHPQNHLWGFDPWSYFAKPRFKGRLGSLKLRASGNTINAGVHAIAVIVHMHHAVKGAEKEPPLLPVQTHGARGFAKLNIKGSDCLHPKCESVARLTFVFCVAVLFIWQIATWQYGLDALISFISSIQLSSPVQSSPQQVAYVGS